MEENELLLSIQTKIKNYENAKIKISLIRLKPFHIESKLKIITNSRIIYYKIDDYFNLTKIHMQAFLWFFLSSFG